ncbi:MAG TPA: LysM peptidoglycan-binding domain-containing protein [Gemmatimonadales bacterium]|nr:LysM peptidoglycan-binding domain-containing protein [Gemmatimonadales bacterium]
MLSCLSRGLRYVSIALFAVATACGGGARTGTGSTALHPATHDTGRATPPAVDSLGAAVARAGRDSAADQAVLDSLHQPGLGRPDSALGPRTNPQVKGEEVEREAANLFGAAEGHAAIAAAAASEPTFDINVGNYLANRRVLEYLEFFQVDAHDRFEIWLARLGRYEGMIRERLRAKGLPEDLVYLTLVESGLSNTAVSRARAVGMWQFIAGTARLYGLTVDPWVDERRDPFRATEAAVNYLADLRERLGGSVYLAAAAYNAGVGRVERGLGRLPGETDSITDNTFFQLADRRYLRRETRDYVPKLIAASFIAKQPAHYGFTDVDPMAPLVFDEISVSDATGLDVIARLADTTVDAVLELNPQFVRGITPPGRTVVVRVPRGRGTQVAARYDTLPVNARITFVDHYVAPGQTLGDIARRYRVSVAMLQSANPSLRPRALRTGQRIIVPMSGRIVPASAWSVPPEPRYRSVTRSHSTASKSSQVGGAGGSHRVQRGETLSQIARQYGVSLAELLDYNDLSNDSVIKVGQVVRIPPR